MNLLNSQLEKLNSLSDRLDKFLSFINIEKIS